MILKHLSKTLQGWITKGVKLVPIKLNILLEFVFVFFCFFPYLKILPLKLDLQPNALLFAIVISVTKLSKKFSILFLLLIVSLLFSFIIIPIYSLSDTAIRSIGNYLGLFFITLSMYFLLEEDKALIKTWLKWVIIVWGVVAFIQKYFAPKIVLFLLNRGNFQGWGGRGVESLSPEPTAFGFVILFFFLLLITTKETNIWLYFLVGIEMVFLAKSSTSLALIALGIILWFIINIKSIRGGLLTLSLFFILVRFIRPSEWGPVESRTAYLVAELSRGWGEGFERGLQHAIKMDTSINERLSNIIFSIYGFIKEFPYGHGYGAFTEYFQKVLPQFENYINTRAFGNRIMSGTGATLFELGIVGLLIPIFISIIIFRANQLTMRVRLFLFFMVQLILLNSVPLGLPYLGIFLALMMHQRQPISLKK